ncbi:MAG: O-antigen ligase family protein [Candidatus Eisenbacteria bacterium]|nr:O-antigen ligase family protein [Candidatus Eisenbacteria bacterium]
MSIRTDKPPGRGMTRATWLSLDNIWLQRVLGLLAAVLIGYFLGQQISQPQGRVIKALVGIFVLYAAWRFPIPISLAAFVLLFPYPFPTVYASSNTIFVFLITAMWLAQIGLRTARPVVRTILDLPVLLLVAVYLLSFNAVTYAEQLKFGLINFSTILAGIFVFYLIVSTVRDEATLKRMMRIITIMAVTCWLTAIWELALPGIPIIPGWILSGAYYNSSAIEHGLRVGGPFQDFELFAEFNALMLPIMMFQVAQATARRERVLMGALTLLNFFVLMATVTRGATIAFLAGMIYMLFLLRKRTKFKTFLMTVGLSVIVWSGVEFYLTTFTVSGSVLERLLDTKIVDGMPDSRTFWPDILARAMEKPWVGHGPHYEFAEHGREKLTRFFWPHNGYLYYLHTVGIFGAAAFLWILGRLATSSFRWGTHQLNGRDYPESLLFAWHIVIVIFAIDQLKIEYLRSPHYQFWPWIVFGMVVATLNVVRARRAAVVAEPVVGGGLRRSGWIPLVPVPPPADNRGISPGPASGGVGR